jgi:hypothetical protein
MSPRAVPRLLSPTSRPTPSRFLAKPTSRHATNPSLLDPTPQGSSRRLSPLTAHPRPARPSPTTPPISPLRHIHTSHADNASHPRSYPALVDCPRQLTSSRQLSTPRPDCPSHACPPRSHHQCRRPNGHATQRRPLRLTPTALAATSPLGANRLPVSALLSTQRPTTHRPPPAARCSPGHHCSTRHLTAQAALPAHGPHRPCPSPQRHTSQTSPTSRLRSGSLVPAPHKPTTLA